MCQVRSEPRSQLVTSNSGYNSSDDSFLAQTVIGASFEASSGSKGVAMRAYMQITGFIFGIVTLGHALRLILHWPVQLAAWTVPMWLSWVAIVVAGVLCIWSFRLAGRAPR